MNACPNGCSWLDFHGVAVSPRIGWVRWSECRYCGIYVGQLDDGTTLRQYVPPEEGLPLLRVQVRGEARDRRPFARVAA